MAHKLRRSLAVSPTTYVIALSEARALRSQAEAMHSSLQVDRRGRDETIDLGVKLAALVIIGLSLELYLKSFMAIARNGRVTPGHNLAKLYSEFPRPLKVAMEERYARLVSHKRWMFPVIGLRTSSERPEAPASSARSESGYATFKGALHSLANAFTRARYFYEEVDDQGWSVFDYAVEPGLYLADTIDRVFEEWRAGAFRGELS